MSKDETRSVEEMSAAADVDNTEVFHALWDILKELKAKVDDRFELTPDASTADLQPYQTLDGSAEGLLSTFTSPEIDWLVYSHIGNPQSGFCNMHLTINLGAHIDVPHFGMALGTIPDIFMYFDYVPRKNVFLDLDYLDKYYQPANETFMEYRKDDRFRPFTSQTLYMRQAQSATSICYAVPPTKAVIEKIRGTAHEMFDRWVGYVDTAVEVPMEERAALSAMDLKLRRQICERDPANVMGDKLFGPDLTERLVRSLWGGDRVNPRVGL